MSENAKFAMMVALGAACGALVAFLIKTTEEETSDSSAAPTASLRAVESSDSDAAAN